MDMDVSNRDRMMITNVNAAQFVLESVIANHIGLNKPSQVLSIRILKKTIRILLRYSKLFGNDGRQVFIELQIALQKAAEFVRADLDFVVPKSLVKIVELIERGAELGEILLDLEWWTDVLTVIDDAREGRDLSNTRLQLLKTEYSYDNLLVLLPTPLLEHHMRSPTDSSLICHLLHRLARPRTRDSVLWEPPGFRDKFEVDLSADVIDIGSSGPILRYKWLGEDFALKVTNDIAFAQNGAVYLGGYSHPHIVQLMCTWKTKDRSFFLMELMSGSLRIRINERIQLQKNAGSPFPLLESVDMMLQVAKAMRFLHSKGLTHGDLNCRNILWKPSTSDNRFLHLKLGQFGIQSAEDFNIATSQPLEMQTASSSLEAMKAADVCSFGLVCFEVLTGDPVGDLTGIDIEILIQRGVGPHLEGTNYPPCLRLFIESCWNTEPRARPTFRRICLLLMHMKNLLLGLPFYNDIHSQSLLIHSSPDGLKKMEAQAPIVGGSNVSSELSRPASFEGFISGSISFLHSKLKAYLCILGRGKRTEHSSRANVRGLESVEGLAHCHPDSARIICRQRHLKGNVSTAVSMQASSSAYFTFQHQANSLLRGDLVNRSARKLWELQVLRGRIMGNQGATAVRKCPSLKGGSGPMG